MKGQAMRFDDQVAFITGGAIGFGRAFARALLAEGARVVIADIDGEAAERTAAVLRDEIGGGSAQARVIAVTCDVADETAVDAAVAVSVERFGGIDILINNAGLHLLKYNQPFTVLPRADLRQLLNVNVVGMVNCTIACRESMRARGGGAIVNISSIAGYLSTSPYAISKLAVRGLTIALATELAPDGIRVNAIAPGLMGTENALEGLPPEMVGEFIDNRQLVHRLGTMDDIAATMMFLCSHEASFITGETIKVSGGYPLSM
jgi:3-oxoacyl-[acyl-carrier protein] reductase